MITFIYRVTQSSDKRGYNRNVEVWRIKNNQPLFVGYDNKINTASYKGDRAIVNLIISHNLGFKMKNGHDLLRQDVQLFEI